MIPREWLKRRRVSSQRSAGGFGCEMTQKKVEEVTADKQRRNSGGGRDERGRFVKGNGHAFKPGESGNPAGRPKSVTLSEALRLKLAEDAPGKLDKTVAEQIAQALVREAVKGNVQAIKEIGDRTEGKPRQTVGVEADITDWRLLAQKHGVKVEDVIREARRLIESATASGGAEPDSAQG